MRRESHEKASLCQSMPNEQEDINCSDLMRRHILEWQLAVFDIENITTFVLDDEMGR